MVGPRFGGCAITTRDEFAAERPAPGGAAVHQFAIAAAEMAANTRCEDVVVLDLRGRSPVTEYFVIATGTSPRQMRTAIDEVRDLGKKTGFAAFRQDGYESAKWIVLDCVNVVVHVFDSESREFYDLELLWGDSPRVDWRQELGLPPAPESSRHYSDEMEEDESEDQPDEESAVEVEIPDESTGSNSVEFIEAEPPSKRGKRSGAGYPVRVREEEDTTSEERAMGPMSNFGDAAADLQDEEEAPAARSRKAPQKKAAPKKPAKKAPAKKAPAKKAAKKPTKKPAKKPAAQKPAGKKAAKPKAAKKAGAKKKSAK